MPAPRKFTPPKPKLQKHSLLVCGAGFGNRKPSEQAHDQSSNKPLEATRFTRRVIRLSLLVFHSVESGCLSSTFDREAAIAESGINPSPTFHPPALAADHTIFSPTQKLTQGKFP